MRTLQTAEITKSYRGRKVVDNVSIWVKQGEVVGLLGPNGAGKTTSFYMIVGLISPDSGRVMLDDLDITPLAMYQRARKGISYLPQEASVFRKLSVEDNLLAILQASRRDLNRRQRRERMDQLIEQLGLEQVRKSKGYVLSGGGGRAGDPRGACCSSPVSFCWTSRSPASIPSRCWSSRKSSST